MTEREIAVLIVEPDLDIQKIYRQRLIHDPDFKLIGICSSMSSALSLVSQTECDILFTEIELPDGNGIDLIRKAIKEYNVPNCAVITDDASQATVSKAIESGAMGYLLKGESDLSEIGSFIRMIFSGGSPLSPSIARMVILSLYRRKQPVNPYRSELEEQTSKNPLSPRETEILHLLARGLSFQDIGKYLGISCHTVTAHIKKVYRKLKVHSRGEAVYEASRQGILGGS